MGGNTRSSGTARPPQQGALGRRAATGPGAGRGGRGSRRWFPAGLSPPPSLSPAALPRARVGGTSPVSSSLSNPEGGKEPRRFPACKLQRDPPRPPGSCSGNFLGRAAPELGRRHVAARLPARVSQPSPRRLVVRPRPRGRCPGTLLCVGCGPAPIALGARREPRDRPSAGTPRAQPCPSTNGAWSPHGCAGPRRRWWLGLGTRRSSSHWSRSARTPWSACSPSWPTCRAVLGTFSGSSKARRSRWVTAPPSCTAAWTPCTPPPRAWTTGE